jgi:hypothetical protein
MTQEMLTTTQANYTKTTEMLLKQQEKLGEIQANLTCLSNSNVSLVSAHHSENKPERYTNPLHRKRSSAFWLNASS